MQTNTLPPEWKDSYCLGEPLTDQQQQHLFALANAMLATTGQGVDTAVAAEFLNNWGLRYIPKDDAQVASYLLQHPLS
jgi:hemerythrin